MQNAKNNGRPGLRPLILATWILLLLISTGCAKKPSAVFVNDSSKPWPMKTGETAPFDGWLLSPGALVDLMECCEGNL